MRCLRHYLLPTFGIRVNAIAPFGTATAMLPEAIVKGLPKIGAPVNTPEQVAEVTLGVVAGSHKGKNGEYTARIGLGPEGGPCNGLSVYVESGKGWELEEGLAATRAEWQGEGPNERLLKAGAWLASVSFVAWASGVDCGEEKKAASGSSTKAVLIDFYREQHGRRSSNANAKYSTT